MLKRIVSCFSSLQSRCSLKSTVLIGVCAGFDIPTVPHSRGAGLPEDTQHSSPMDYVCVSGKLSVLKYVDHLHEHFHHLAVIKRL